MENTSRACKAYTSNSSVEMLNSFNLELQLKDTKLEIKYKTNRFIL